MAGVCEGHALAGRFGLDQKKLAEILNISSGRWEKTSETLTKTWGLYKAPNIKNRETNQERNDKAFWRVMSQMNLHTYGGGIHTFIFELVFFFRLWTGQASDPTCCLGYGSRGSIQLHPVARSVFCIHWSSQRQTAFWTAGCFGFSLDFFRMIASIVDIGWQKPVCKNSDCQWVDAFQWNLRLNQLQSLNLQFCLAGVGAASCTTPALELWKEHRGRGT